MRILKKICLNVATAPVFALALLVVDAHVAHAVSIPPTTPLPNAMSYEYFGFNYAENIATSTTVGTLTYTGKPGCGGICTATTTLGGDPTVSLNVSEVTYEGGSGGYAVADLSYYVEYNNAPGNYAVNLHALDALAVDSASQAQAYLGFGPAVPPASASAQPQFASYLV